MKHLGNTPPFRGPKGEVLPGTVAEIRYLPLGGLCITASHSVALYIGR